MGHMKVEYEATHGVRLSGADIMDHIDVTKTGDFIAISMGDGSFALDKKLTPVQAQALGLGLLRASFNDEERETITSIATMLLGSS